LYDSDAAIISDLPNAHQLYVCLTESQENWQQRLFKQCKDKNAYDGLKLSNLFLPGSHDAGMYLNIDIGLSNLSNTQADDISTQLKLGSRYIDFRPGKLKSNWKEELMKFGDENYVEEYLERLQYKGENEGLFMTTYMVRYFLHQLVGKIGDYGIDKFEEMLNGTVSNEFQHIHAVIPGCTYKECLTDVFSFLSANQEEIVVIEVSGAGILDEIADKPTKAELDSILSSVSHQGVKVAYKSALDKNVKTLIENDERLIILYREDYKDGESGVNLKGSYSDSAYQSYAAQNIINAINDELNAATSVDGTDGLYIALQLTANAKKGAIARGLAGSNTFTSPLRATKPRTDRETYTYLVENNLNYHDNKKIFLVGNDFYENAMTDMAIQVNRIKLGLVNVSKKQAKYDRHYLQGGDKLYAGELIYSKSKMFYLTYQQDGNLVMYRTGGKALWSTSTHGKGGHYLSMQSDGNLVIYKENGGVVWALTYEDYSRKSGAKLYLQDDSNLVMYSGNDALWSSGRKWVIE